jgi:hypothetical protein
MQEAILTEVIRTKALDIIEEGEVGGKKIEDIGDITGEDLDETRRRIDYVMAMLYALKQGGARELAVNVMADIEERVDENIRGAERSKNKKGEKRAKKWKEIKSLLMNAFEIFRTGRSLD